MRILFLGEGDLAGSARYLAAILGQMKAAFDYRPDQSPIPAGWLKRRYDAVILSDYRYTSWTSSAKSWLEKSVRSGTGLMMLGGWGSFTGLVGGYARTEIETMLPVRCIPGDDRVNRPALLRLYKDTAAVVNGYNRVRPRPGTRTELEFQDIRFFKGRLTLGSRHPALVIGHYVQGRTAAFMTDCAPHWAGGLIDLGPRRIAVPIGGGTVEVGSTYLALFRHWIRWTARAL